MIIFTTVSPTKLLSEYVRYNSVAENTEVSINNISSYYAAYPPVSGILPNEIGMSAEALSDPYGEVFDREYFQYLLYGNGFIPFMDMAYQHYMDGSGLYIYLFENRGYDNAIIEAISRTLSVRYGIQSNIVYDIEDVRYMPNDMTLSSYGLQMIVDDFERYKPIANTEC